MSYAVRKTSVGIPFDVDRATGLRLTWEKLFKTKNEARFLPFVSPGITYIL